MVIPISEDGSDISDESRDKLAVCQEGGGREEEIGQEEAGRTLKPDRSGQSARTTFPLQIPGN